ncbi:MAG: cupin domain-containing protein [bacterium]|nr:cupin domain-containing protein [bacterium]
MNTEKVIRELFQKYPGKKIIKLPEDNPAEIICEIDPAIDHPEKGIAIAIIDKSEPHYHKKITERYKITKGELTVFINNQGHKFKEGDSLTVKPGEIHYAVGNETWAEVNSEPRWTQEEHILVS